MTLMPFSMRFIRAVFFRLNFLLSFLLFIAMLNCGHKSHTNENRIKIVRLAHGLDVSHSVHKAMVFMAQRVQQRSHGKLKIIIYPSSQLGGERECLELLQIGSLGMVKVSSSALEGFVPQVRVFGLPYLFDNDQHRFAVLDGQIGSELLLAGENVFLRGLCYYDSGYRSFYSTKKPILQPEDLQGLKIRVQESNISMQMVQILGGSATPIAWGELYTALQSKIVDGAENNPPSFYLSRHYEVCRHYVLNRHTAVPDILLISTHVWQTLSTNEKKILQEAAQASAIYQRKLWQQATRTALEEVKKAGVKVYHPDIALFRKKMTKMYDLLKQNPNESQLYEYAKRIRKFSYSDNNNK